MNVLSVFGFVLCLLSALQLSTGKNNTCERSDGKQGFCKRKRDCPLIFSWIKSRRTGKEYTEFQRKYIRHSGCSENTRYVCCEEQEESEGIRLLKDQNCGTFGIDEKVIGGREIKLMSRPWMALLRLKRRDRSQGFLCGGTLIAKRFVLTAAHCFDQKTLLYVRLGEHDVTKEEDCGVINGKETCAPRVEDIQPERIFVHEEYSNRTGYNDIALIRLSREVPFSGSIKPICLPLDKILQYAPETSDEFHVTGWGRTENVTKSDVPKEAIISRVDRELCYRSFNMEIKPTQLCAGNRGRDSCNGDSGGPLMDYDTYMELPRFVQFGIVSRGSLDCGNGQPAIYTNVGSYIDWIADKMVERI